MKCCSVWNIASYVTGNKTVGDNKYCTYYTFVLKPNTSIGDNERADGVAGVATKSEGQPLDHVKIINNLRNIGRVKHFMRSESTSVLRLCELGVMIGITKNEWCSTCMKEIIPQYWTGTISCNTLMYILRRTSEYPRMCPEYYDDDPSN